MLPFCKGRGSRFLCQPEEERCRNFVQMGHKLRNQRWSPNQGEGSGLLREEMEHWGWEAGRYSKKAELIPEVGRQIFSGRGYDPEGEELLRYLGDLQLQPSAASGCRKWVPQVGAASGCRKWAPQVGAANGCRKWVPQGYRMGAASGCRVPGTAD